MLDFDKHESTGDAPALTSPVVTHARPGQRTAPRRPRPAPGTERFGPIKLLGHGVIWLFTLFNLFILYWLLVSSLKSPREIFGSPFGLPHDLFTVGRPLRNWATAWSTSGFDRAFLNTGFVVALSCLMLVVIGAPAAYALSRLGGRRTSSYLTTFMVIGIGVPFQTIVIPLFVAMSEIGLANSLWGLTIVYIALSLPFTVFLLTGFFASLPDELEEAAAVDGLGPARTFLMVMLPLARGGIITVVTLNAIGLWNETLLSVVMLQDDAKFTIARALWSFYQTMQYNSDYGALMAGIAIVVLPMLILYIFLARRIIEGLTLGTGK